MGAGCVRRVGGAVFVAFAMWLLGMSANAAALTGCSFSDCRPQDEQIAPVPVVVETTVPPTRTTVVSRFDGAPTGTLPFTGSDIVFTVALGFGMVAGGGVLLRLRRR